MSCMRGSCCRGLQRWACTVCGACMSALVLRLRQFLPGSGVPVEERAVAVGVHAVIAAGPLLRGAWSPAGLSARLYSMDAARPSAGAGTVRNKLQSVCALHIYTACKCGLNLQAAAGGVVWSSCSTCVPFRLANTRVMLLLCLRVNRVGI